MARPTWHIEPDSDGELTLWRVSGWEDRHPVAVARRCETPPELWALGRLLADDPGSDGLLVSALGRVQTLAAVDALADLAAVAYRFSAGRPAIELEVATSALTVGAAVGARDSRKLAGEAVRLLAQVEAVGEDARHG